MGTIVALHAHPDDEALLSGGWLASRAAAGDRIVLAFATDGDAGLTGPDRVRGVGALAGARRAEAQASADALGVARVVWLGWGDSGMDGRAEAPAPRFVDVPVQAPARAVADLLDAEDADVLTGYDARGGYGHPDHVQVHRVARAAQDLAVRRPLLLEVTMDRTWLVRLLRAVRPFARVLPGITVPGDDVFSRREEITHTIDVRAHLAAKRTALAAHCSQTGGGIRTVALLLALPAALGRRVLGTEWFVEVP